MYTRALLTEQHRRTGDKPYLVPVSDVEATDINEPFDFMMADLLYNELLREGGAAL